MRGTDELREWASVEVPYKYGHQLTAIADRIDAEHEEAIQQALMGEGGVPATDENMAEHGWVRLPKDADNVPWNVGDRDEDGNEVIALKLSSDGWFVITDGEWLHRPGKHHYHAPTVEDVLTEMFTKAIERGELTNGAAQTIAEYASKLQLREDAC